MLHTFRAGVFCQISVFALCRRALRGSLGALSRGALRRLFHRGSLVSNGAGGGRIACGGKDGIVDPDLCIGCTQCTGICPEVFQMTGILAVAVPGELPPDTVPTAVEAAQACPVSAITISE